MNFSKFYKVTLRIPKINFNLNNGFCISTNFESNLNQLNDNIDDDKLKENLFISILNGIILETKDFYIIDKPVGISLFRSQPLANLKYNGQSSKVTVEDILPALRSKLKLNDDSLFISSELSYAYSGLFVLSKTKRHLEICKSFYKNSSLSTIPGYINQSYRCLCWNLPRKSRSPVGPFTYSIYQPSETDLQYSVSFRSDRPSRKQIGQRRYWTKHIGHDLVSVGNRQADQVALVDVQCNSTYRGVIPLYLLHQGCIVIGEFVQASRLLSGGINNDICILPPEKTNPAKPLPLQLRQRLGAFNRAVKELPIHIHCRQLLVPAADRSRKTAAYLADNPVINVNANSSASINWDRDLKLNVCTYGKLPKHFSEIMAQLDIGLPFDEI